MHLATASKTEDDKTAEIQRNFTAAVAAVAIEKSDSLASIETKNIKESSQPAAEILQLITKARASSVPQEGILYKIS